jgi:hypothetical protein
MLVTPLMVSFRTRFVGVALGLLALSSGAACKNGGKRSEEAAKVHAQELAQLIAKDVAEIERGLPAGATKGASYFVSKQGVLDKEPQSVRKNLLRIQREVPDLLVAKSTFIALLDSEGVAVRNNLEVDAMAGLNLFKLFPELSGASSKPLAFATGNFKSAPFQPQDPTWVAATAVKSPEGQLAGYLATGWSYRRFAYHLQEHLKSNLKQKALDEKDLGKLPIVYVAVFDGTEVYGAPQTPAVNETAMKNASPAEKTRSGAASGVLELEGRTFGWAAEKAPAWGEQRGVILLRSEI